MCPQGRRSPLNHWRWPMRLLRHGRLGVGSWRDDDRFGRLRGAAAPSVGQECRQRPHVRIVPGAWLNQAVFERPKCEKVHDSYLVLFLRFRRRSQRAAPGESARLRRTGTRSAKLRRSGRFGRWATSRWDSARSVRSLRGRYDPALWAAAGHDDYDPPAVLRRPFGSL
jgi:hypothetical protein